jgi:SAM-dependent methyltransferase
MGKQSQAFLEGEGNAWALRNNLKPRPEPDPVVEAIADLGIKPINVLEVGCGNGQRLTYLAGQYHLSSFYGIDPAAKDYGLIYRGTADDLLDFHRNQFDLVIYGFCLYLCDPEDYFNIAREGDRVLSDGGYIIIHDFCSADPFKRPYKHKPGIYSHHMDFERLWSWNPNYRPVRCYQTEKEEVVSVLKKDSEQAFPIGPEYR